MTKTAIGSAVLGLCIVSLATAQSPAIEDESELLAGDAEAATAAQGADYEIEQANIIRLLTNGSFDPAVNSGKRLVVTAIDQYSRESLETATALNLLAKAQHGSGDHAAAAENYQAAIELYETLNDRLDRTLIDPLRGLGRTQLALKRPDRAARAFERSLHINQVNEGPQNLQQTGQLAELTEAYFLIGDMKQADALQKLNVSLYARKYPGADDKRRIPSIYQYAKWLHRMALFLREQAAYIQIIRIIERADGRESLDLIPALTGLGKTYVYSAEPDAQAMGERRLRRAIAIARENPASNPVLRADTEISLGDFYVLTGDRTTAKRSYLRAWDFLTNDESDYLTEREERFAKPFPLTVQDVQTESFTSSSVADFKSSIGAEPEVGYVLVGYDISARGSVSNIEVLEAQPPGLKDGAARAWVKRFKFRPRVEERKLLATPEQVFEYQFTYFPTAVSEDEQASQE